MATTARATTKAARAKVAGATRTKDEGGDGDDGGDEDNEDGNSKNNDKATTTPTMRTMKTMKTMKMMSMVCLWLIPLFQRLKFGICSTASVHLMDTPISVSGPFFVSALELLLPLDQFKHKEST